MPRYTLVASGTILIIILAGRTFIRGFDWRDGLTLYSHDIKINTSSFDLENNLGNEYYKQGNLQEAKKHFEFSISLTQRNWFALNNLATVYFREDNISKARELYQEVVDNSDNYLAYQNFARLLILYDSPSTTKKFVEQSLEKFPTNSRLWTILAIAHYRLGEKDKALSAIKKSYEINPDDLNTQLYQRLLQGLDI